jgi:hypothetical protein
MLISQEFRTSYISVRRGHWFGVRWGEILLERVVAGDYFQKERKYLIDATRRQAFPYFIIVGM